MEWCKRAPYGRVIYKRGLGKSGCKGCRVTKLPTKYMLHYIINFAIRKHCSKILYFILRERKLNSLVLLVGHPQYTYLQLPSPTFGSSKQRPFCLLRNRIGPIIRLFIIFLPRPLRPNTQELGSIICSIILKQIPGS